MGHSIGIAIGFIRSLFRHVRHDVMRLLEQLLVNAAEQIDAGQYETVPVAHADQFDLAVQLTLLFDQQCLDQRIVYLLDRKREKLTPQNRGIIAQSLTIFAIGHVAIARGNKRRLDCVDIDGRQAGQPVNLAVHARQFFINGCCGR